MANNSLRVVYMGTPDFAVPPLEKLIKAGYTVVAVVTASDKTAGRGKKIRVSAVKQFVLHLDQDLPILQPANLKDPAFVKVLRDLEPDLQIVVAFRMLPEIVWRIPRSGTFNLHASLLPQYRGAAPINHAIINGETETGVTTFMIDEKIDTGKILLQENTAIGDMETAGELHDRLMALGAKLVLETVTLINEGNLKAQLGRMIEAETGKKFKDKFLKYFDMLKLLIFIIVLAAIGTYIISKVESWLLVGGICLLLYFISSMIAEIMDAPVMPDNYDEPKYYKE